MFRIRGKKFPNFDLFQILKILLSFTIFSDFLRQHTGNSTHLSFTNVNFGFQSHIKIVHACVRLSAWLLARPAVALVYICLWGLYCTVLYCTAHHSTVLYCTVLYCTLLCCTLFYCIVLHCIVLYSTVLYSIVQYSKIE